MILVSAPQGASLANYSALLFLGGAFSIVLFVACLFHVKYSVQKSAIYTIILFSFFYFLASSSLNKFYELELNDYFLTFKYASSSHDVTLPLYEIKSIKFGAQKHGSCYLVFEDNAEIRYKSVILSDDTSFCKHKRRELISMFELSG